MKINIKKLILFYLILSFITLFINACEQSSKYDFTLLSSKNEKSLKDFKGQKIILYFGFTTCPDICPGTLALLSSELKNFKNKPLLLFISLDPVRDNNLTQSDEWLTYFYPNSLFLLPHNENELQKITQNYGVIYEKVPLKNSALEYTIAHSNDIFLFDEKAKLFNIIKDLSQAGLKDSLKEFLKE